jgi:hypothetical protein
MASGGIPIKLFLVYPPRKTYFDIFLSVNPKNSISYEKNIFFKESLSKIRKTRFTLYVHPFYFPNIFL